VKAPECEPTPCPMRPGHKCARIGCQLSTSTIVPGRQLSVPAQRVEAPSASMRPAAPSSHSDSLSGVGHEV